MTKERSVRDRMRRGHIREKATIEHLVREVFDVKGSSSGATHAATTAGGLPVEQQVRKVWAPQSHGLPIF
jgi:hypothetical protein